MLVEIAHVRVDELYETYDLFGLRSQEQRLLVLLRVLEFYFFAIFALDKKDDLDPDRFLALEGENAPEAIPNKLAVDSLGELAFDQFLILLQEHILNHLLLVVTQLKVLLPIGQVHRTARVYYQVRVDRNVLRLGVDVQKVAPFRQSKEVLARRHASLILGRQGTQI